MGTLESPTNVDCEIEHKKIRGLEEALKITQWESRSVVLFRNLLDRVKGDELRTILRAVEGVWEMSILRRIKAGAPCEPGEYEIHLNPDYLTDPNFKPLLIYHRDGGEVIEVTVKRESNRYPDPNDMGMDELFDAYWAIRNAFAHDNMKVSYSKISKDERWLQSTLFLSLAVGCMGRDKDEEAFWALTRAIVWLSRDEGADMHFHHNDIANV